MNILFYKIRGNFNYHLKISAFTVSMCLQDSCMQGWDLVCQRILNQTLSIWHGFLQPLFISRVKVGKSKDRHWWNFLASFPISYRQPILKGPSVFFSYCIFIWEEVAKSFLTNHHCLYILCVSFILPNSKIKFVLNFFFNLLPLK